jgi:cholesterol oxidase
MLASKWDQRSESYEFVVVGSGYGGAITSARIAAAARNGRASSVCILERGRERWPGTRRFPDTVREVSGEFRSDLNSRGLYELMTYRDISVIKGCGLGGTSLINANVAATPDPEVFEQADWPRSLTWQRMRPYFDRARAVLGAGPDPRAWSYPKVQAMDRRARQLGTRAVPLDLAINFTESGVNEHGVPRRPCRACGDCTTGCNRLAKNALYMNYLPMARNAGAQIFTSAAVQWIEKRPHGGWRVHGTSYEESSMGERFALNAGHVILAAGSINSTEILLRSQARGLSLSPTVGTRFSCNGDFFGLAYNGGSQTLIAGIGNRYAEESGRYLPGPAIVSGIHYNGTGKLADRFQIEDLTVPSAYVAAARRVFPTLAREHGAADEAEAGRRIQRDLNASARDDLDGALNHTMFYLIMAFDDAQGRVVLDPSAPPTVGRASVIWEDAGRQRLYTRLQEELRQHARALGASYIANPVWSLLDIRHLITAHPIGGCPIGEDHEQGTVDEFGRVFARDGAVHAGLFVADGAVIPRSLGVNPFLTISALAEQIAERQVRHLGGDRYPSRPVRLPV